MSGLHVNNLSHAYGGTPVVKGVSVFVAPGEVVCLLGPSGCGKTTLLRVAAGLEVIQKGQVRIGETIVDDGATGLHVAPDKRGIGLMFQDYALFPHLSVRDNILFGVGADTSERRQWLEHALEQMGLTGHAEAYPHTLSGGQQQRIALLRALAPEPKVLFLDEPFSGLDVTRRTAVRAQTSELLRESGVATLLVTHDPEEAMFMADRILVMDQGRVVQDGTPENTYFAPVNAFVADLFGPVNRLDGTVRGGHVETPVGTFDAPALADGTAVQVLIRQEGLRLAQSGQQPATRPGDAPCRPAPPVPNLKGEASFPVTSARPLGRASMIAFAVPGADGAETTIEARVPGVFLPEVGSRVTVTVNAKQAHVFAVGKAAPGTSSTGQ